MAASLGPMVALCNARCRAKLLHHKLLGWMVTSPSICTPSTHCKHIPFPCLSNTLPGRHPGTARTWQRTPEKSTGACPRRLLPRSDLQQMAWGQNVTNTRFKILRLKGSVHSLGIRMEDEASGGHRQASNSLWLTQISRPMFQSLVEDF